jgi:hypothetical protein
LILQRKIFPERVIPSVACAWIQRERKAGR